MSEGWQMFVGVASMVFLLVALIIMQQEQLFPPIQPVVSILGALCCAVMACRAYNAVGANALAWCLRVYLWTSLGFAGVYYTFYFFAPDVFAFSSSIAIKAHVVAMDKSYGDAKTAFRRTSLLKEVGLWITGMDDTEAAPVLATRTDQEWHLPRGITVRHLWEPSIDLSASPIGPGGDFSPSQVKLSTVSGSADLRITDAEGTESWSGLTAGKHLARLVTGRPQEGSLARKEYLAALAEIEADEAARARSACSELRSPKGPRAYSLADFVYFSFITVTTLGYGDMVPNSTMIRLIVVVQILIGLMLILRAAGQHWHDHQSTESTIRTTQ